MLTPIVVLVSAVIILIIGVRRRWHRLEGVPDRPRAFEPATGIWLFASMFAAGLISVGLAQQIYGSARETTSPNGDLMPLVRLMAFPYAAQLALVVVYAVLQRRAAPPRPDRRPGAFATIGLGVFMLVIVWPVVQTTAILIEQTLRVLHEPPDPIAHETLQKLVASPRNAGLAAMVGLVVIAVPLVEEVMYRGLVQQSLRQMRYSAWVSIAVTSVIFAAMHYQVAQPAALGPLFVLSLGLGWAYERTGRIAVPMIMHGLFNLGNVILALNTAA